MYTITLEWNAVTTWEDHARPSRDALTKIIAAHRKYLDVGIVTTAASENTSERNLPATADEFRDRLAGIGWSELTLVPTIAVWSLTYWELCDWATKEDNEMISELWSVLAPSTVPESPSEFAEIHRIEDKPISSSEFQKWRNVWCDVHSMNAHIRSGRDMFVTGDIKNFKGTKKTRLREIGMKEICSYDDALRKIPHV